MAALYANYPATFALWWKMDNSHRPYSLDNSKPPLLCERQQQILWYRGQAQCQGPDWWLAQRDKWFNLMLQLAEDEL